MKDLVARPDTALKALQRTLLEEPTEIRVIGSEGKHITVSNKGKIQRVQAIEAAIKYNSHKQADL